MEEKSSFFSGPATKRWGEGEGGQGWATKKNNFAEARKKNVTKNVPTKLEGGGALVSGPLK